MMARLFTTAYPEPDPVRRAEYAECLARNLACPAIDEVRVLAEGGVEPELPEDPKLFVRPIASRPTYDEFFAWIRELAGPNDVSVIANSDLFFDEFLGAVERFLGPGECYALSRWDLGEDGHARLFERGDSQDSWIVRGPVRPEVRGGFPLGVYDCDNKIAWELEQGGYRVANPAFSLRSYHLHRGAARSYDPENPPDHGLRPPFRYVEPDNLASLPECWRLWRQERPGYFPWRFTWRKFLRTRAGRPVCYLMDGLRRRAGGAGG